MPKEEVLNFGIQIYLEPMGHKPTSLSLSLALSGTDQLNFGDG